MILYKASPVSRESIRHFIRDLKRKVGLEYELYFPILHFVENVLPLLIPDFQLEIVPVIDMGGKHGETYPSKHIMRIREDVYLRAAAGEGRDRLTIAHEVGHLFMHDDDYIALCRMAPDERLRPFEDPEWQADAFGGELLASSYLIIGMTESEIQEKCGVSLSAAHIQLKAL
ncbi:MAG: ImmA/IrrE family metallo-endopeptidase [Clostridia bacterium]|nr:ImmA/IrrE family metallo-endopeptidase [Clostridia bacterium]MBR0438366.1 ImmA/IrrE family metallo-endopeptidase [Clostridia bacterium]